MKHTINLFLISAIISIAMFTACQDDKDSDPSSLIIDQTEVDVLAIGGQTLINVNTDLTWSATVDADWLRISPASGNGSGIVKVEIDRHLGVRRAAKVSFTAGAVNKTVEILQRGQIPIIDFVRGKNIKVSPAGGIDTIFVRSNLDWAIAADADWIHIIETIDYEAYYNKLIDDLDQGINVILDGELFDFFIDNSTGLTSKCMVISVDANKTGAPRSGNIIFTDGDYYSDTVTLSQGFRDADGYFVVDKLPFREQGKYEVSAVEWQGQVGSWGEKFGVLAYKVTVAGSGKLKIIDHASPTYNIWFLLCNDKAAADKGDGAYIAQGDGTVEYSVTPGTYYVFGIMNTWYEDLAKLNTFNYDIEITCE